MTQSIISAVSLTEAVAFGQSHNDLISTPCISLELANGSVFKGDAILTGGESLTSAEVESMRQGLVDQLVGTDAADFGASSQRLSHCTYVTTEMRLPLPGEKSADESKLDNRREMLTRFGVVEKVEPKPIPTEVTYPLPRHIIRGASLALLQAAAHAHGVSTGAFLAQQLGTTEKGALKFGIPVDYAEHGELLTHATALSYAIPPAANSKSLGKDVEKFQLYLRQLNGWIEESWSHVPPEDRPWLFIDLNGTVHRLNNEVSGKTLGSLFGFGTTGNQAKMIFANTVMNTTALRTANDQTLMQSLVKSRKLSIGLAAACWTNSLENVQTWLEKCKPSTMVVHLNETADVHELIRMIQAIQQNGANLVLVGDKSGTMRSWSLMHDLATAAQPLFYLPAGGKAGLVQALNGW